MFQLLPIFFDEEPNLETLSPLFNHEIAFKEIICTDSNLFYFKKRNYKLLENIMDYIKDEEV